MHKLCALTTVILLFAILIGGNIACTSQIPRATTSDLPSEMPKDFSFSIDYGILGRNNINTKRHTFTKDLVTAGSKTISFVIPDDKMREVYDAFREYQISDLPANINAEAQSLFRENATVTIQEPANRCSITYTCNKQTRTIVCDDGGPWDALSGPPNSRNSLVAFVSLITDYIYSTEAYQKMPPAVGGYE